MTKTVGSLIRHKGPLTFGESTFFAEQTILVHLKAQQSMPQIHSPLFGTVGPFQCGQSVLVPLHLMTFLAEEQIAIPQVPDWLLEENLTLLVKNELETEQLCSCPHPHYIEIARLFTNCSYNPWSDASHPHRVRCNVMRLFEDLVSIRQRKIIKYNSILLRQRGTSTTPLSHYERRTLGTVGVDYLKRLELPSSYCSESLEDLLASMNVFDADLHYELQEKAQMLCTSSLEHEEDIH